MRTYLKDVLGREVYDRRRASHKTQEELAEEVGVSANSILKIEKGYITPGVDKVWAIPVALDCSPNELLGWNK